MTTVSQSTKRIPSLAQLAKELDNVAKACLPDSSVWESGTHKETFYKFDARK